MEQRVWGEKVFRLCEGEVGGGTRRSVIRKGSKEAELDSCNWLGAFSLWVNKSLSLSLTKFEWIRKVLSLLPFCCQMKV